jgi:hypothetical protein
LICVHRRHLRLSFLLRACSLCNPPADERQTIDDWNESLRLWDQAQ